jgi:N-acetylneuraminic acid mutarotase
MRLVFSIATKGYLGTGTADAVGGAGPFYKNIWEYDPSANTWTSIPDYPGSGNFAMFGFSIGVKAYVGGGEAESTVGLYATDVWELNIPSLLICRLTV